MIFNKYFALPDISLWLIEVYSILIKALETLLTDISVVVPVCICTPTVLIMCNCHLFKATRVVHVA